MEKKLFTAEEFAADESFIAYYLKSDPAAVAHWERWIALNPQKIDEVQIAENLLDLLYTRLAQHELEAERARLTAFIQTSHVTPPAPVKEPAKHRISLSTVIRAAAIITVICSVALFFFRQAKQSNKPQHHSSEWVTYTSPRSQQSTLSLSDGTQVNLNAGSTLSYPKSFTGKERVVRLTGQAFFDVSHDQLHPFIVNTDHINTRVLGTAFNVSSFKEDNTITVALLRGSVQIEVNDNTQQVMRLKPGEKMQYSSSSGALTKSGFDDAVETGWRNNLLAFNNAGFKTIASAFYHNYGIRLINHSTLKELNYTGQFKNQTPTQAIKAICFSLNLNYTIQDSTIVLSNL